MSAAIKKEEVQKIGVLSIQGTFAEHISALQKLDNNVIAIEVRCAKDLTKDMRGLVIPGGESTTMGHFLKKNDFLQDIKNWIYNPEGDQKFVWGTCAGLILLANDLENEKNGGQCKIGGLSIIGASM